MKTADIVERASPWRPSASLCHMSESSVFYGSLQAGFPRGGVNKGRMTLQALRPPKKLSLRPQAGDHTKTVYGETREAAMNDRIEMLVVAPLAARSHASNV
ncbi:MULTISPECIES: hypothetical protein [unclassified Rhizobium]|uniref:hypothetical protein n=2 Tax=Rhizobium/Agrobacterium group TaxID=227290 RepID=UPI001C8348E4|nr:MULTISPECIES: hypothetical protein [unclassified Rhizobium]MBX5219634.1 hypothetical protein [Rhizobium sp. NLR8a]MBX5237710.1 hypothetical protein [Rhizobium sp. NLR22b]